MVEGEGTVKWLYPGADKAGPVGGTSPVDPSSDMESELQTDQSVQGSEVDKSSITSTETDADSLSGREDLPLDTLKDISADISNKMAAASSYVGSLFQAPSSWYSSSNNKAASSEASPASTPAGPGADSTPSPTKPTAASSFSSSFFSVLGKVAYTDQREDEEEQEKKVTAEEEEKGSSSSSSSGLGYLTSAFSRIGLSNLTSTTTTTEEQQQQGEEKEEQGEGESLAADFFTSAISKVGKAATSYSKVLQETVVAKAPLLADFNKEQEDFIRAKGDKEIPVAPWSGYQNEDDLKEKILALSADSRNFLRAPPGGVNFDLETAGVAAHALVLLKEDPRLERMRYELVPKKVKEDEFWRNYFYRVGLVKQSFELTHGLAEVAPPAAKSTTTSQHHVAMEEEQQEQSGHLQQHEEEFVSDSHRVSSQDLAEADEAVKRLGLAKDEREWEAELEGELNEYELVEETAANPEWEDEIQAMLAAETSNSSSSK